MPKCLHQQHSRPDTHFLIYYDECVYVVQGFAPQSLRLPRPALQPRISLSHWGSSGKGDVVRMTDGNQFPSQYRQIQSNLIRQLAQFHRPSETTLPRPRQTFTLHYRVPEGRISFIFSNEKYIFLEIMYKPFKTTCVTCPINLNHFHTCYDLSAFNKQESPSYLNNYNVSTFVA